MGQATGGVVNGFGEIYQFALPHTQLGVQVSTARFVRPSGDASDRGGVAPDVEVEPAPPAAGDAVVLAALAALRAGSAAAP